jgi:hypothetical protein
MMEDTNGHVWGLGVFDVTDRGRGDHGVYRLVRVALDDREIDQ